MIKLAEAASPELLAAELGQNTRVLSFRGIELHLFRAEEAPTVMDEIGRIREKEFRDVGAGRNLPRDLDDLDYGPYAYRQLLAWDPEKLQIVAAYRYLLCGDLQEGPGFEHLRTARLFNYSDRLRTDYLPYAIELGRSVVNREADKAIMGLYCAWAGLGALMQEYPWLKYFFGNFSVYTTLPGSAISLLLAYLERHHAATPELLLPHSGLEYTPVPPQSPILNGSLQEDFDAVLKYFAAIKSSIPPILLSYLGANEKLLYLGTACDHDFGGALECAIMVPVSSLNEKTRKRFIDGYTSSNPQRFMTLRSKEPL